MHIIVRQSMLRFLVLFVEDQRGIKDETTLIYMDVIGQEERDAPRKMWE